MGLLDESGDDVLDGRDIHYKITRGLRGVELVHQVEIKDDATGIRVKSGKFLSVDTSWRKAKELYTSTLIAAGHLNTNPPVVQPSPTPIVVVQSTPVTTIALPSDQLPPVSPTTDVGSNDTLFDYAPLITGSVVVLLTIGILWFCACRKDTSTRSARRERHQRSSRDTDQLKIRDMMNKLGSDVCCWELFATELGMEPGNIERIKRKERGDDRLCFMRVLEEWRANPPPEYSFTMQSVVTILRKPPISLNRLANQIERGNH